MDPANQNPQQPLIQPQPPQEQPAPPAPIAQPATDTKIRNIGIALSAIAIIFIQFNNVAVACIGLVISAVGTYLITKARRISPLWSIVGLFPLVGPAIALFIKPVKSVYGAQTPGQPKKSIGIVTVFVYLFAVLAIGILLLMILGPKLIHK